MANPKGRPARRYRLEYRTARSTTTSYEGTVLDLSRRTGLPMGRIYQMAKEEASPATGWAIERLKDPVVPAAPKPPLRLRPRDRVHTLVNPKTGERIQGTQSEIAERFNVRVSSVSVFLGGHNKSLRGWVLPGKDLPAYIKADMEHLELLNIWTGEEARGTREELLAAGTLTKQEIERAQRSDAGPWCRDTANARRVVGTGLRPNGRWAEWTKFRIRHRDGKLLKGTRKQIIAKGMDGVSLRRLLFGDLKDGNLWTVEDAPISISEAKTIRASLQAGQDEKITWHNVETGEEAVWSRLEFCAHQDCTRSVLRNHLRGETAHVAGWVALEVPGRDIDRQTAIAQAKAAWEFTVHVDTTVYTWMNVETRKRVKATRSDLIRRHGIERYKVDRHMLGERPIAGPWVAINGSSRLINTGKAAIEAAELYHRYNARGPRKKAEAQPDAA